VALKALLVGVACFFGSWAVTTLRFPGIGSAILFPPYAILTVALLLSPARDWWVYLVAASVGSYLPHRIVSPTSWVMGAEGANYLRALVAAGGMRYFSDGLPRLDNLRGIGIFLLFGVCLAPLAAAFVGAGVVRLHQGDANYWLVWRAWFLSNALTGLTLLPAFMVALTSPIAGMRSASSIRVAEAALLSVGLLTVGMLSFMGSYDGSSALPDRLYAPLPFLLWGAVRFGIGGASVSLLLLSALVIGGAVQGQGPFITHSPGENLLALQLFLITVSAPMLILGAALTERHQTAAERRKLAHDLDQRVKDLTALHRAARILHQETLSTAEWLQELVSELPPAWQYPEITEARIRLGDLEVRTPGFALTPWRQCAEFTIADGRRGAIEVVYREERPAEQEGPFSTEERHLIDSAADLLQTAMDRRQAVEALRESEERFRTMGDSAPVMVWQSGPDKLHTWFNRGWLEFTGRTMEQELGNGWEEGVHPEDFQRRLATYVAAFDRREPFEMEYRLRRAEGKYGWILDRGLPLHRPDGSFVGYIGAAIDITARKEAHEEAQRRLSEVAHLARAGAMGEMAASIAHELNQPLGAILSNAGAAELLLAKDPLPLDEIREILADIRADNHRASEVVVGMRALLRRHDFRRQPVDANDLVRATVRLLASDALRRHVAVGMDLSRDLPALTGDQVHLQQVLMNLLLNGMDAAAVHPAEARRVVVSTGRGVDGSIEIAVSDSGQGIPEADLSRIFEPFYTTKDDGLGMGLSIARTIVEMHGGCIAAENRAEGGAIVRITLPGEEVSR
jgi:PAS domain S-box-containing protein